MHILEGSNILITGGTGLVGAHVIEAVFAHKPHKVVTTIRTQDPFSYFFTQNLHEDVVLAYADIRDFDRMVDIVTRHEIDVIFHLAAQPIVSSAYHFPQQTVTSNVNGTMNVLETARRMPNMKAVLVASSDKAYGASDTLPYTEETRLEGLHPYDGSKSATDIMARGYFKTYGLPVAVTRFGNIYGPGDDNFNRVIPGVIKSLIHDTPFEIRSDGEMIREYVYVKDVAQGYLRVAEEIETVQGEAFNFGSEHVMNVKDIAKGVMDVFGKEVAMNILNTAKNEIPEQHLDFTKAQNTLNWKTQTSLHDGLQETISWYKNIFPTFRQSAPTPQWLTNNQIQLHCLVFVYPPTTGVTI